MRRVSIVGSPGAGKTTLARELAAALGGDHIELDSLNHMPGWTERPRDEFRALLSERLESPTWAVCGNYGQAAQDLVWAAADTVVWLDLPRRTVMWRVFVRTLRRAYLGIELWNGNRERPWYMFKPKPEDNILLWTWTQFGKYRERYVAALADPQWTDLNFVHLRTPDEVAAWRDAVVERAR